MVVLDFLVSQVELSKHTTTYRVIVDHAHVGETQFFEWFDFPHSKDRQHRLVDIGFIDVASLDFTVRVTTVVLQKRCQLYESPEEIQSYQKTGELKRDCQKEAEAQS